MSSRQMRVFLPSLPTIGTVLLSLFVARDAPARNLPIPRVPAESPLAAGERDRRQDSWAVVLEPLEISHASTGAAAHIRLYDSVGDVDENARAEFEKIAAREPEPHSLATRVEQLVFKAAYHFGVRRVHLVSGWRERAGKHATGEAIDFRLDGVSATRVAAFLRGLPRVGVGIYTHPGTQFVHVDIREPSYAWIDASPPGVHWRERQIGISHAAERDASYVPESDLPFDD
jgi:uncharacterized protein YcbK (DUF882 family)